MASNNLSALGVAPFSITNVFNGYRNKVDLTNVPEEITNRSGQELLVGTLVAGSQNVRMTDADRVATRLGYTLDGAAAAVTDTEDPIVRSFDWQTSIGIEQHLRAHHGALEYRQVNDAGTVAWAPLLQANAVMASGSTAWDGTNLKFNFAEYWNTTELIAELLFVNGDAQVYRWSGAQATLLAATSSAISMVPKYSYTSLNMIMVTGTQALTSFTGTWTTAGNSVVSGTTADGTVAAMIIIANQPAQGDTLTLSVNGVNIVIKFGGAENLSWMVESLAVTGSNGPGTVRIGKTITYTGGVPTGSSDSIPGTVNNLTNFLANPTLNTWSQLGIDTGTAALLGNMSFNGAVPITGAISTTGATVSGAAGILTIALGTNPSDGDTWSITANSYTFSGHFVSTIGATAGNVLIGATAADTATNLYGLLGAPGTTNTTQVALSATDQIVANCFTYQNTTGLTIKGSQTWAELGFYASLTGRGVMINSGYFSYTGGETTLTLTGVGPDPVTAGLTSGMVVVQAVQTQAVSGITGMASTFRPDLIDVLNNQIFYGSTVSRTLYLAKQNAFGDVSASSPRVPGDGATFYLDACPTAFGNLEDASKNAEKSDSMLVSAGTDNWYQFVFTLSQDLKNESVVVRRMATSRRSAAQNQGAVAKIKQNLVALSFIPTLDFVSNLEKVTTAKNLPISDPVKNDFDAYDFTNVHVLFADSYLYIAVPAESKLLIFNLAKGYWEAPQILPVQRLAIIDGNLYGHSNQVPETYRLFYGTSDNGNPINAIAAFAYHQYGMPANEKNFSDVYVEGYISPNTALATNILYEFGGAGTTKTKTIMGNGDYTKGGVAKSMTRKTIFAPVVDPSLGKNQLGMEPIGTTKPPANTLNKFRVILTFAKYDFFECQFVFQSNDVDQQWELLRFGPRILSANVDSQQISV